MIAKDQLKDGLCVVRRYSAAKGFTCFYLRWPTYFNPNYWHTETFWGTFGQECVTDDDLFVATPEEIEEFVNSWASLPGRRMTGVQAQTTTATDHSISAFKTN